MATVIYEPPTCSELERQLLATPAYHFDAMVKELDVLRDVLLGRIGTAAQRNALLRVIKANAPSSRLISTKLASHLGLECYLNEGDTCTFASYEASFRPVLETMGDAPASSPTQGPTDEGNYTDESDEDDET